MVESDVAYYLLNNGLLTARDAVDGSVELVTVPSRHAVVRVTTSTGPSYAVKCYGPGHPAARREARVHALLREDPALAEALPDLTRYDDGAGILVFALSPVDGQASHWSRPTKLVTQVARLLAALHRTPVTHLSSALQSEAVTAHAHLLDIDETALARTSRAATRLIATAQADPDLGDALRALGDIARPQAVIHGDLRWSNILVLRGGDATAPAVHLVDWETAGLGDPAWDVACLLAEHLGDWLCSIPKVVASDTFRNVASAGLPLQVMQDLNTTFWRNYTDACALDRATQDDLRERVIRFVGARLMARALELDHRSPTCSADAVTHLQVGARALTEAPGALVFLLGLSDSSAGP